FSGQCHTDAFGIGERFVKADDRGAIAYFASTGYGFISALDVFGDKYYRLLGGDLYGESIGTVLQAVIEFMSNSVVVGERELAQQTTLQGDPSLLLYPRPGPDYLVDNSTVRFDPALLNTQLDSFDFSFEVANIGQHLPGTTMQLEIEQQLPNGERVDLLSRTIETPAFSEALQFSIPILGPEVVGFNRFHVKVDADDEIEELPAGAEANNDLIDGNGQLGFPVFIVSNDVRPILPTNYSIVNTPAPELIVSTLNATAAEQSYRLEIDTTALFNSPLKQNQTITQSGGLIKWQPNLNLQAERVYYWRASPDSTAATAGYRWQSSSFIYLPDSSPGWNQSHYFQLLDNEFINMEVEPSTRKLDYIDNVVDIKIRNVVYEGPSSIPRYYRGSISQIEYEGSGMTGSVPAGVLVAALDTVDILPMLNPGGGVFGDDYGFNGQKGFLFRTNSAAERAELINFLENEIPDGHYVILFTVQKDIDQSYQPEDWALDSVSLGTNLFQVLEAQGAQQVRLLEQMGSFPYSFLYRKNESSFSVGELIGPKESFSEVNAGLPGNWISGRMSSVLIGPAAEWQTLNWTYSDFTPAQDSIALNLYGVQNDGSTTLLISNIQAQDSALTDLSTSAYPYLQLEFFTQDETEKTSSHLEHWRIHYKELPEAALNIAANFDFQKDTLVQGETLSLTAGIVNISAYDMDSLLVRYTILSAANDPLVISQRLAPLSAGADLSAQLELNTRELSGAYSLTIDVNPDDDQPELTHINNVALLNFYVQKDNRNPLLDVTFDGTHIMDGDLVSATPNILVSLTDDNPYLELADTTLFRMLFLYPDGTEHPVYFADPAVQFYPAGSGQNNRAQIELQPSFEQDGLYRLYIEAMDASGNPTGNLNYVVSNSTFGFDYQIGFEVINKQMISNVLNYPNPFSTSTRFVYTLTGSEAPTFFKIQIMTVSGRIVRELTQADLGMLRPGTHQTDFAWNGTDAFGDPLANGVYLYRVIAQKA
ncbi:MAG: hypothetical protein KDC44_08925, partial [Phaeodactylibacter sp.]|nr:hypothetical protein [Phaeodactylibacter sp.]